MGSRKAKRILVVDDNHELAESLSHILEREGYQVVTATDPVSALERARETNPEICILDLEMPIMDGYELAKRLREMPPTEHATLIALTGYGRDNDPRRAQEAGFSHHLVKPVDTGKLVAIIDQS